jgi:hypothetical protein
MNIKASAVTVSLLIAGICLAVNAPSQSFLTNGLIAYYPFNGNANDAAGNGNNGTVNGLTLTTDRFGNLNSAYAFPGIPSKDITINSTNLLMQMPFSCCVWVNFSGGNYNPRIVCLAQNYSGYEIATAGTGSFRQIGLDDETTAGGYSVISPDSFAAGVWHHVAAVWDTNKMTLYVDGRSEGATTIEGQIFYNGGFGTQWLPTIGDSCSFGDPNDLFAGAINDVRFYNRALSSNEVAQLYAIESTPVCIPHGATAMATVVGGFVVAANITNEGCGYTNAPLVLIQGGGGTGATATAVVANGMVVGITITSAGIGYTGTPAIYISFPLTITGQPHSLVVNAYDNASFSVTASGTGPGYQWSLNGTNIPGATSSSLTISNVTQSDLGTYTVAVTDVFGSETNCSATLSMYPIIVTPFTGGVTYWGTNVSFLVQAWGTGPFSYQWFDNGVAIPGATNAALTFTSIQFTNAGLYSVVLNSPFGSVTNSPEQVVVNPAGVSFGLYPGVTINGVVGNSYVIQRTANLGNTNSWVTAGNFILTQPVELWVDTNVDARLPGNPYNFYRILPGQ